MGPCAAFAGVKEVRILNRIVRWVEPPYGAERERIVYEADPRHASLIIHPLGLSISSRGVSTPNEKSKIWSCSQHRVQQHGPHIVPICNNDSVLSCVAQARPAIPIKRIGAMDSSTNSWRHGSTQKKRVARWTFVRQVEQPSHIVVFTDSDPASCLRAVRVCFPQATFKRHHASGEFFEFG